jgi:hypothetical protein
LNDFANLDKNVSTLTLSNIRRLKHTSENGKRICHPFGVCDSICSGATKMSPLRGFDIEAKNISELQISVMNDFSVEEFTLTG